MPLPLEITFRDIENTEALDARIRKNVEKLNQLCDRIIFCRVEIDAPQKNKHQGKLYQVNIELDVPGKVLMVNRNHSNEDLYVAIRDSFNAMKKQLKEYVQKLRGVKKKHAASITGKIVRLFPDYGFIETAEGTEYYFNESNVQISFTELTVGQVVRFVESSPGETLQANQVSTT